MREAAAGDLKEVFEQARQLEATQPQGAGASPMIALIEPYLRQAGAALARAVAEGPTSGAWAEADRAATTARLLSPTSPDPLNLLGEIALAQGNLNRADQHFTEAVQLDEDNVTALTGLARSARARRDTVGAEALLRRCVAVDPRDWRLWLNLGTFLMETSRTEEAEKTLERAVALAGGAHPAPSLALAELLLDRGRPSAALVHAERALVISENGYGYYLRGRAWMDMEQLDRAEADLRQAVLLDSGLVQARGAIGRIRWLRGDLDAAAEAFRAVLRIDPDNDAARENLRRVEALQARGAPPSAPR
jgi:Flp pilus assembly protein TadD